MIERKAVGFGASDRRPTISVIMANYRGAEHLPAALESVLNQSLADIEIIVSDDASPDASVEIVRQIMAADPRVSLIESGENRGPAAARNAALRVARGEWIAIVDSDDIIHPERFERLLAVARRMDADAVADDLLFFSDAPSEAKTLLGDHAGREALLVSPEHFVLSAMSDLPSLGYLKPLFRRAALGAIAYDEAVRIGEDYDFLLRFLLQGGRFYLLPEPLYLYRRHAGSISHRLSEADVRAMMANHEAFVRSHGPFSPKMTHLLERRYASLQQSLMFERLVAATKKRQLLNVAAQLSGNPSLLLPLLRSATAHVSQRWRPAPRCSGNEDLCPLILVPTGYGGGGNTELYAALGLDRNARVTPVSSYRSSGTAGGDIEPATRDLWVELAKAGSRQDTPLVCHGLAGLYAASFLPNKTIAAIVIEEPLEVTRALEWATRASAPLVVAESALGFLPPGTSTRQFCTGFHTVEAMGDFGNARMRDAGGAMPRTAEGGYRHG